MKTVYEKNKGKPVEYMSEIKKMRNCKGSNRNNMRVNERNEGSSDRSKGNEMGERGILKLIKVSEQMSKGG